MYKCSLLYFIKNIPYLQNLTGYLVLKFVPHFPNFAILTIISKIKKKYAILPKNIW